MASGTFVILGLSFAAIFLSILVWLMLKAASNPNWGEISSQVKKARKEEEGEHGI
jgi:hypothetical protein